MVYPHLIDNVIYLKHYFILNIWGKGKLYSNMNIYVLFNRQNKTKYLLRLLNKSGLLSFVCKMEYYRKDRDSIEEKELYPGYIFIKSELNQLDFDKQLSSINDKYGLIKQLKSEGLPALSKEEQYLFDILFDDLGVLKMSYCTLIKNRAYVHEGPLKGLDSFIIKYDKPQRLAYLNVKILNIVVKVGLININSK